MRLAFIAFLLTLAAFVFPPLVRAESVTTFDASYVIERSGSVAVTERITYDFGAAERHGIVRVIPFTKKTAEGNVMKMTVSSMTVDSATAPDRFSQSTGNGAVTVKIGDPDKTVSGKHTYILSYRIDGALTYFSDHDEFYWNVNGTEWNVPIGEVKATVTLPDRVSVGSVRLACHTGVAGSTVSDCTSAYAAPTARFSAMNPFSVGENLTIVFAFPKGVAAVIEPKPLVGPWEAVGYAILTVVIAIGSLIWYIGLPVWIVLRWFKTGRDPKPTIGVTSAWFDAPKTESLRPLTPGETGTLIDEQAEMRDITATIVDLARRGWWRIVEKKKDDFHLVRAVKNDKLDELRPYERTLYDGILGEKDEVRIKGGSFSATVEKAKEKLYEAVVSEGYFPESPEKVRTLYLVLGGIGVVTMNLPLALASFIFGTHMPKKTPLGSDTAAIAASLRNFITKEERHFRFQAKNQLLFEKFLPFAVAFGVERIWADRFADIAMHQPDWYSGYGTGSFNSVAMIRSFDKSFVQNFAAAATPTRSSSGFSSGFSGGHSGGGGGGGGGGSW